MSSLVRALARFLRVCLVALSGLAPPYQCPPFRHDDPPAEVVEDVRE